MKNVFVSSTFRDMQVERDMIQEIVVPELQMMAKKYGENVNMIDLRWGVDTSTLESDEGAEKIMSVCMDEIERSQPYMLIMIGERYGTILNPAIIHGVINRRNDAYDMKDYEKSVTAIEIEYGALSKNIESLEKCIVCFREPVSEQIVDSTIRDGYCEKDRHIHKKLADLKEDLEKTFGDRIIHYTCEWDEAKQCMTNLKTLAGKELSAAIVSAYIDMFQKEWSQYESMSVYEKEQLAAEHIAETNLKFFQGREELLSRCNQTLRKNSLLFIRGEAGIGKTAFMSKLADEWKRRGASVFECFIAHSQACKNTENLIKHLVFFMEQELGIEEHFEEYIAIDRKFVQTTEEKESVEFDEKEKWLERLMSLYEMLEEKDVYIMLDAVDSLTEDTYANELAFLSTTHVKVHFVLSCSVDYEIESRWFAKEATIVNMQGIDEIELPSVVQGIFSASSRNVYDCLMKEILQKEDAKNPLYLNLIVQRLNMLNYENLANASDEEKIIQQVQNMVRKMPGKIKNALLAFVNDIIERLEAEEEFVWEILHLLAVAENGLRVEDLQSIIRKMGMLWNNLDFSRIYRSLNSFFIEYEDGSVTYRNQVIREAILETVLDCSKYEEQILERLWELPKEDGFKYKNIMYYIFKLSCYDFAMELIGDEQEHAEVYADFAHLSCEDGGEFASHLIDECMRLEDEERSREILFELVVTVCAEFREDDKSWPVCEKILTKILDEMTDCQVDREITYFIYLRLVFSGVWQDEKVIERMGILLERYNTLGENLKKERYLEYVQNSLKYCNLLISKNMMEKAAEHFRLVDALVAENQYEKYDVTDMISIYVDMMNILFATDFVEDSDEKLQNYSFNLKEMLKKLEQENDRMLTCAAYAMAIEILNEIGDLESAIDYNQKAINLIDDELKINKSIEVRIVKARLYQSYSWLSFCTKNMTDAVQYSKEVLKVVDSIHAVEGDLTMMTLRAESYHVLGQAMLASMNMDGLEYIEEGVELNKAICEKTYMHSRVCRVIEGINSLARFFMKMNFLNEAEEYCEDVKMYVEELENSLLTSVIIKYEYYTLCSSIAEKRKDYDRAKSERIKSLQLLETVYQQKKVEMLQHRIMVGYSMLMELYRKHEELDKAVECCQKMQVYLEEYERENTSLKKYSECIVVYHNMSEIYWKVENKDEYNQCMRKIRELFTLANQIEVTVDNVKNTNLFFKKHARRIWDLQRYIQALLIYQNCINRWMLLSASEIVDNIPTIFEYINEYNDKLIHYNDMLAESVTNDTAEEETKTEIIELAGYMKAFYRSCFELIDKLKIEQENSLGGTLKIMSVDMGKKCLEWLQHIEKAESGDIRNVAIMYRDIGQHYEARKEYGNALSYTKEAVQYARMLGQQYDVAEHHRLCLDFYARLAFVAIISKQGKYVREVREEALQYMNSISEQSKEQLKGFFIYMHIEYGYEAYYAGDSVAGIQHYKEAYFTCRQLIEDGYVFDDYDKNRIINRCNQSVNILKNAGGDYVNVRDKMKKVLKYMKDEIDKI